MYKRTDWELSLGQEKAFWLRDKERVCSEWWLELKKNRANRLRDRLSTWMTLGEDSMILQIGSGPEGEINFLKGSRRFAIDPLANFYKSEFSQILDPSVSLKDGVGEELPYEDNMFDLVLICNALDHTYDPPRVLSQIHRVLRSGGICHVAVHAYPPVWIQPLKLLKRIQGSKDHPWRYTPRRIIKDICASHFHVLETTHGNEDELSIPNWLPLDLKLRVARSVGLNAPMLHVLAAKY